MAFEANITRLKRLQEMELMHPNDPFFRFAMAQEYTAMNDWKQAKNMYETLLTQHPDYLPTYYHLGKLEENLNTQRAIELYKAGIALAEKLNDSKTLGELKEALFYIE